MAHASDRVKIISHINRPTVDIGTRGLQIASHQAFEFEIGKFGPEEIKLVLHDSEVFTSLVRSHPTELAELFNNVLTEHMEQAVKLASEIGLTEEAFQQKGGGPIFWLAIGIAAGMISGYAATTKVE
jgi:hypothetical protein